MQIKNPGRHRTFGTWVLPAKAGAGASKETGSTARRGPQWDCSPGPQSAQKVFGTLAPHGNELKLLPLKRKGPLPTLISGLILDLESDCRRQSGLFGALVGSSSET